MSSNVFEGFNFFKDYATEGETSGTRNSSMIAQTPILSNQNFGLILDLSNGAGEGRVIFK